MKTVAIYVIMMLLFTSFSIVHVPKVASESQAPLSSSTNHVADPVLVDFFVNGFGSDSYVFDLRQGSQVSLNVTATYPWNIYPSALGSISIQYSIVPFPLSASMPNWLSLAISQPSVDMARGTLSSVNLFVSINHSAKDGQQGSFAIDASYIEPMNKFSVTQVIVVNVTASSTAGAPPVATQPPSEPFTPQPLIGSSWALGAGLCDTSIYVICNLQGIQWNLMNGIKTPFTVPAFHDSATTYITLNGGIQSNILFQVVILAPSSGSSTWQESLWVVNTQTQSYCHSAVLDTVSSGSAWTLAILYVSLLNAWVGGSTTDGYLFKFSNYCTFSSSTTFYSENQEPFAFESYDFTSNNFALFIMNANPAFQYQQGSTWSNPIAAFVVNGNNGGSWLSYVVGNSATPSLILEGGHLQCTSIATYQLYIGYYANGPLYGCGTNTYDVKLMN